MTDPSSQEALERRRTQNREAQRRFRRKRNLQASIDWNEVLSNTLGSPTYIDIQPQEIPPSDISFSPTSHLNSTFSCGPPGYFDCLTPPPSEYSPQQDVDKFLEYTSSSSAPNIESTFASSRPSPHTCSTPKIQTYDKFSCTLSSTTPSARPGSVGSASQGHSLGTESPSDYASALSGANACGWLSPLHMAARRGNDRIVWLLLQQGVDCDERDSDNLTPIMHGVIGGHEEVVRSLLLHGADIGDDNGTQRPSALHLAVTHRRENILRVLLNHCSDNKRLIDSYDDEGRTPLHIAISTDFEAAVLMLLQYGADPQTKAPKTQKTEMDLEGLQRIDVYGDDIE